MYVIKERVEAIANGIFSPDVLVLRPGKWSADNVENLRATGYYTVVPNLDYAQPYLSMDAMHVAIFHTEFDKLSGACYAILRHLNVENPHDLGSLYTAAKAEGYLLHDVNALVRKLDANDFIEGSDYYVAYIDILIQYARIPVGDSQTAYVEGT